ncbi:Abc1 family protein [Globisporangium polare]
MSAFTLEKLVEIFAPTSAPVEQLAADAKSQTFVAFTFDSAQEYAAKPFITPLLFLFRGRSDLVLLQTSETDAPPSLSVFKDGAKAVTVTAEGELKDRITALLAVVGWSPDCPGEEQLPNFLAPVDYKELLGDVDAFTTGQRDFIANGANVAAIIWNAFVAAQRPVNWAGFYFIRPLVNPKETDHERILILGPFVGKPACSRIRLQNGVCGAAARTKTVQRIADVHQFEGHIACDGASESEIVVPVFNADGDVVAVIDLDCPKQNGFSVEDERHLIEVARLISERSDWLNLTLPYTQ